MNQQQGMAIVEGFRRAQAAGAPVLELKGEDARNFAFVKDKASRKVVLGSFGVEAGKKFFVSVVSSPSNEDDYSFAIFEKFGGPLLFSSNLVDSVGVVWKYQPAKQHGSNQARKKAFFEAAKSDSITIPFPAEDLNAFSAAVTRAIDLRHLADAAGGTGADDEEAPSDEVNASDLLAQLFTAEPERTAAARLLAASIRFAHAISPKSWCVTNPAGRELVRLNVGNLRVLDLLPGQVKIIVERARRL